VTGDAATDTFRLKLLQHRARCYLMTHALKACKRDIKSLITAGGPVSGEWRRVKENQTDRDRHKIFGSDGQTVIHLIFHYIKTCFQVKWFLLGYF
jgi:hypothetical protein